MNRGSKILVTGGGGFIGGWIVDALYMQGRKDIRAGIHSWKGASRVARLPVEIVLCDVLDRAQIAKAMEDVGTVVHCAVGSAEATVAGTENMLEASARAGVRRFVHLSTVDVYGDALGEVSESVRFKRTGSAYGDTKIDAEELCWSYHGRGLPLVVLRPSAVYGPYNKLWVAKFAERILSGRWGTFGRLGDGICNLVYITDMLQAVFLAMNSDRAVGEAFNVNGTDDITWNDYFMKFNAALGGPPLHTRPPATFRASSVLMTPLKAGARYIMGHFSAPVTALYQRSKFVRGLMRGTEERMKTTPGGEEIAMFARKTHYTVKKGESLLGFRPAVDVDRGLAMSVRWLAHESQLFRNG
jgi:nucleoside-diphosphate-sugar epimerase